MFFKGTFFPWVDIFKILYYSLNLKNVITYASEEISVHYLYLNVVTSSPKAQAAFNIGRLTSVIWWIVILFHLTWLDLMVFGGDTYHSLGFISPSHLNYNSYPCPFSLIIFISLFIFYVIWECFPDLSSVSPSCTFAVYSTQCIYFMSPP